VREIGEFLKILIHDVLRVGSYQISQEISENENEEEEDDEIQEVSAEIICEIIKGAINL
jgi:hypothetical protein